MAPERPIILLAPVLKAENWLSINLHKADTLEAFSSAPEWQVVDAAPEEKSCPSKMSKRLLRDVFYPLHLQRTARKHARRCGVRPILHVIDHSYGHLCAAWTPSVITCHDLHHFVCPALRGAALVAWRFRVRTMKRARHIFTVSAHLAGEVREHLGIPESRITVAHNGVDHATFRPLPHEECVATFPELSHMAQTHRLILHIGSNYGRKNLPTLLRALARLKHEHRLPAKLLKVGHSLRADGFTGMMEELGIAGDVVELGRLTPQQVAQVCHLAHVLSFPSLYEGFGRPTLEAQACALPCILAESSCMREIGGTGALYHNGTNDAELADHLKRVLTDTEARGPLIRDGLANARRFTWEAHVRKLTGVYEEIYRSTP